MSTSIELNVLDIYLDTQNPRHEPTDEQGEIIKQLISTEQIRTLALDIAKHGLSPIELFAVIKDKSDNYIVVEGNRRLCAISLLNDPKLSPGSHIKYFTDLSKKHTNFPSTVECQLFNNRADADTWIERRHEGQQDGIGTKQWDANQKTRYNTSRAKPDKNASAQALIDYAVEHGLIPKEKGDGLLTTVTRYLSNPLFRKTIGIQSAVTDQEVVINITYDEFRRLMERIFKDMLGPKPIVNSRSDKTERERYARHLITDGDAPVKHSKKIKLTDENTQGTTGSSSQPQTSGGNKSPATRNNQSPDKRPSVIPNTLRAHIKNSILKRVFDELRSLDAETHTLASSLLCRAFLENIYNLFHEKNIKTKIPAKTHSVMLEIIDYIKKGKPSLGIEEKNAFTYFKSLPTATNKELNPSNLGANAHANHYPKAIELKREWDNVQAFILYMLNRI